MKKITYERTGGFMGRKVSFDIDLDKLPEEQADRIEELLNEADFFELPANLTKTAMPDSFTYTITVETKKGKHSVRVGDITAPDDLRPLLDELNMQARMQR